VALLVVLSLSPASRAGSSTCAWQATAMPALRADVALEGVASLSTSEAWAVGWRDFGGAVVLRWDGVRWSRMLVPKGPPNNQLLAVSASSARNLWAVGWNWDNGHSLTMHSEGGAWRTVPSPNLLSFSEDNQLTDVVALARDDVWAVGRASPEPPRSRYASLIMHWNGKRWAIARHRRDGFLYAIAARGKELWAVGWMSGRDGLVHALALHYDGSTWSELGIPRMRYRASLLRDVTVTPSGEVWAIGDTNTAPSTHDTGKKGSFETLAFRIAGERLVTDEGAPLAEFKAGGSGDGESPDLGLAPISTGGLLAYDAGNGLHVYRRTFRRWRSVSLPPPEKGLYVSDVGGGSNASTWLTGDTASRPSVTRYVCT
jgi:hypothetical protein